MRGVLNNAFDLGLLDADELAKCLRAAKRIRGEEPPPAAGRAITQAEFEAMLAVCLVDRRQDGLVGRRDAAIIALSWVTGMRRGELARLDLADLDTERATLTARGKRRKRHVMPLDADTLAVVGRYLDALGRWAGPLFVRVTPGRPPHRLTEQRFRSAALYEMLLRRAVEAGVERFSPHDLRRTALTAFIRCAGLRTAQRLAGHSSPEMTARYDRSGREAMVEAVEGRRLQVDVDDTAAPGA